jgi:drug/metabolite transporter (DMT)-like permease
MTAKTVLVLALMIVAGTIGDVLISKGMKEVGEITSPHPVEWLRIATRAARNPSFAAGVVAQVVYFSCFSAVLSWTDVSVVVPIGAVSFLFTAFLAQHALGEHVTPQRWAGTSLIVIGIMLVARSHPPPTQSLDTTSRTAPAMQVDYRESVQPFAAAERRTLAPEENIQEPIAP